MVPSNPLQERPAGRVQLVAAEEMGPNLTAQ